MSKGLEMGDAHKSPQIVPYTLEIEENEINMKYIRSFLKSNSS